jgi:hypothetical protein
MGSNLSLPKLQAATVEGLSLEIINKLAFSVGKDASSARGHDWLKAAILVVRDRVIEQWMASIRETYQNQGKRVYYLSMEFLIGRLLRDAASNLGLFDTLQAALEHLALRPIWLRPWSQMRHWAMAAWGALRPASWRAWRALAFRPLVTAFATATACSARKLSTAYKLSCRRTGWFTAIHGNLNGASAN